MIIWEEFLDDLYSRFEDLAHEDVVAEFNELQQQWGIVKEYQLKFEEIKPYMLPQNSGLGESYFIFSFVNDLKELQNMLKLL